jgi:hypothetical protein
MPSFNQKLRKKVDAVIKSAERQGFNITGYEIDNILGNEEQHFFISLNFELIPKKPEKPKKSEQKPPEEDKKD